MKLNCKLYKLKCKEYDIIYGPTKKYYVFIVFMSF